MKKQITIYLMVFFISLLSLRPSHAQSCGNAVNNGSFKYAFTGWTISGTGPAFQLSGNYDGYIDLGSSSTTGNRTISQVISNIAVENDSITVYFNVNMTKSTGLSNAMYVRWNGNDVLYLLNSNSSTPTSITTYGGATARVAPGEPIMNNKACITLRIPYSGSGAASGTLALNFPVTGYSGIIYFDNFYIPSATACDPLSGTQPSFTCEEGVGYLFQNDPSAGFSVEGRCRTYQVDLSSGAYTEANTMLIDTADNSFTELNCFGYNPVDNYIWGYRMGTNQLVRLGSDWSVEYVNIPGLPLAIYSSGDVDADGIYYMSFVSNSPTPSTMIERIDLNTLTRMAPLVISETINFIDFAVNPVDGSLYVLNNAGASQVLVRIDKTTGVVTALGSYASMPAAGYGGGFFDNEGNYFVSGNGTAGGGNIYRFTRVQNATGTTGTAPAITFMATGPVTTSNDGARCPYSPVSAFYIAGHVWNDANGDAVKDLSGEPYINLGTTSTNGLWVNLINSAGEVASSSPVGLDGRYSLSTDVNGYYSIILTEEQITIGEAPVTAALPDGWIHTGTNVADIADPSNTTGVISGIIVDGTDIDHLDFGLQQLPDSEDVTATIGPPAVNDEIELNGAGTNPPLMNGSDPEDGVYTGNAGTVRHPQGVIITSLPTYGDLHYDGVIVTADDMNDSTLFSDPSLFSIILTGSGYTETKFEYAYMDAAGGIDPSPAIYKIDWSEPLSVKLLYFNVHAENDDAILSWSTASEQNNKGFEIQRSKDSRSWEPIEFINTMAASGTSFEQMNYGYKDVYVLEGKNFYRLKQIDRDGKYEYSPVRLIDIQKSSLISIYPNPVRDRLYIKGLRGDELVTIYDIAGQIVDAKRSPAAAHVVDVSDLREGIYILKIKTNGGDIKTYKFFRQK